LPSFHFTEEVAGMVKIELKWKCHYRLWLLHVSPLGEVQKASPFFRTQPLS
jgi:hypothetical protein